MEKIIYNSPYNGEIEVAVVCDGMFDGDGSPCITLYSVDPLEDGELYEQALTVSLVSDPAIMYGMGCAYLSNDVSSDMIDFIERNKFGEFIGHIAYQGFATFKLYHFDMKRIMQMTDELIEHYKAISA